MVSPAYSAIKALPHVDWGRKPNMFGDARVWVLHNLSGLNVASAQSLKADLLPASS